MATWRFYVCDTIGDGSEGDEYRPRVADIAGVLAWSAVIKSQTTGANRGRPARGWGIVFVLAEDHSVLDVPQVFDIGAEDLSAQWGSFSVPYRNQVLNWMATEGIDSSWIVPTTEIRAVIDYVGKDQDPAFDISIYESMIGP